jgi:hypothetical protein
MSTAPVNPNKALWEKGDFTRIADQYQNTSTQGTMIPATFLRVTVVR